MDDDLTPAHSELPPSSSDKWLHCLAWRRTVAEHRGQYGPPPPAGAAAEEGTRAHALVEAHLRHTLPDRPRHLPRPEHRRYLSSELSRGPAEPLSDPSIPDYDHFLEVLGWVENQPGTLFPERRVDYGRRFGFEGLTGTADLTFVEPDRLTIGDFKWGRVPVEVGTSFRPNPQVGCYLVGAIEAFGPRDKYRLAILQPRAPHSDGPIRVLELTPRDLEGFLFELEEAIRGSFDSNPQGNPGPWCRKYCEALSSCKAFRSRSLDRLRNSLPVLPTQKEDAS